MPAKRMLMLQTRMTARPCFQQVRLAMSEKKSMVDTPSDLGFAVHGSESEFTDIRNWTMEALQAKRIVKYWDFRGETNNTLPQLLLRVITRAIAENEYAFLGVFDDDAYYPQPNMAVHDYFKAFDSDSLAAGLGPMGAMRKFRRFDNKPEFMEHLERSPWATLGSQVYRLAALKQLDLSFLDKLNFRADAIIAMLLVARGWGNYEMDINLSHTVSHGLMTYAHDAFTIKRRRQQIESDYVTYESVFRSQVLPGNSILFDEYMAFVHRLQLSELNSIKRMETKLGL